MALDPDDEGLQKVVETLEVRFFGFPLGAMNDAG